MAATWGRERRRGIEGEAWTGGDGAAAVMAMAEWRSNKCVWSRLEAGYGGVETGVEWRWRPFDEKPGKLIGQSENRSEKTAGREDGTRAHWKGGICPDCGNGIME